MNVPSIKKMFGKSEAEGPSVVYEPDKVTIKGATIIAEDEVEEVLTPPEELLTDPITIIFQGFDIFEKRVKARLNSETISWSEEHLHQLADIISAMYKLRVTLSMLDGEESND